MVAWLFDFFTEISVADCVYRFPLVKTVVRYHLDLGTQRWMYPPAVKSEVGVHALYSRLHCILKHFGHLIGPDRAATKSVRNHVRYSRL